MSIRASRVTKTVQFTADGVEYEATIQKLAGRHLGNARRAWLDEMVKGIAARGGAAVQKDIQQLFENDPQDTSQKIKEAKADPLNGLDPYTLILYGVKSWTCPDDPIPADLEARRALFDDLDDDVIDQLARAVLKLAKPALFQTDAEIEADRKNA